jgi:hypothetical protein
MSPILNSEQSWHFIGAISTGPGTFVRDAFRAGHADKVLLPGGFKLYKFSEYRSLSAEQDALDALAAGPLSAAGARYYGATLTPWWSAYDPYQWDPGWVQRKATARLIGVSIREWGRVTSAIKENWSTCRYLIVAQLTRPVFAFFGGFSQMARIDPNTQSKVLQGEHRGRTRNLPGGSTQFYIPSLRRWRLQELPSEDLLGQ